VRKVLGFLQAVKHPTRDESLVSGVSVVAGKTEESQYINVFGLVVSETNVRSTPEESVHCPGIETALSQCLISGRPRTC
jgi:hypothetical protein